uniref:Uncharacterized protein n=1 Tax=Chromera velia CCMP2878 TaxID=1169474 RepID=A0A0G4ICW9_9ALVE|eukprot:Cvel_2310.t1-p1 / transcript=Cvel_2310.t1 / gene=Cvel_2310 / organism=Chromera_velia_CCMP2878 / gene_product=hypothetical protein / transcript_product=hypothetical protein / location=Cvel_scaffold89:77693-78025(-) / protein_length=111 / sequence_SO=supercontig / SO=protein_coding / is_pseudo=false
MGRAVCTQTRLKDALLYRHSLQSVPPQERNGGATCGGRHSLHRDGLFDFIVLKLLQFLLPRTLSELFLFQGQIPGANRDMHPCCAEGSIKETAQIQFRWGCCRGGKLRRLF